MLVAFKHEFLMPQTTIHWVCHYYELINDPSCQLNLLKTTEYLDSYYQKFPSEYFSTPPQVLAAYLMLKFHVQAIPNVDVFISKAKIDYLKSFKYNRVPLCFQKNILKLGYDEFFQCDSLLKPINEPSFPQSGSEPSNPQEKHLPHSAFTSP